MKRSQRNKKYLIKSAEDLPDEAPRGLDYVWLAYIACVDQVGIQKSRRPNPKKSFWKRLPLM